MPEYNYYYIVSVVLNGKGRLYYRDITPKERYRIGLGDGLVDIVLSDGRLSLAYERKATLEDEKELSLQKIKDLSRLLEQIKYDDFEITSSPEKAKKKDSIRNLGEEFYEEVLGKKKILKFYDRRKKIDITPWKLDRLAYIL